MADYIDRKELIEILNRFAPEHYSALVNMLITKMPAADVVSKETHEAVRKALQAFAETDVVQVVRCKDCKHYIAGFCTRDINGRTNMFRMSENDYCSYGERKADNA